MKLLHYVPVVFSCLLTLLVGIDGCHTLVLAFERLQAGTTVWAGASALMSGLLSLAVAWFLLRWASSVRKNARISVELAEQRAAQAGRVF
ncbi:hypothetical protein G4G28_22475 [Massilia sp. Dwa41.01b]|uniref:hypothetical protein n=1 Tax=unclassified Massilia TaxID=2609279 RepID=UPI0015FEBCC5|nr:MULTISPECIES: hypothetical protein [unclassified Massilia]QNA90575.1 hypothetical protein G4G28_22475 [Massilia sp. Dwa41.01b]QNA97806.1 hypothetical protein G4G31_01550 [Massilia sp. Se16.2.3]